VRSGGLAISLLAEPVLGRIGDKDDYQKVRRSKMARLTATEEAKDDEQLVA
jgi:hypothetical protein